MKLHFPEMCLCIGLSLCGSPSGFADDQDSCSHPELRNELAKRVEADQAARKELIEAVYQKQSGDDENK